VVLADLSVIAHAGSSSGATTRTVGDELRGASIERFDEVPRNRFELQGELARGGLGRVMRARDPRTGRVVALKEVLRPSPDLIARFAREAMVTANLQHPAIVPVYEVGRWPSGEPFYAMKLVRGRALDALIADASTTAARVALLPHVIAIAEALAYAHSERVIHRDLKPANVLVGPYGETVVIDWGLARNLGERDLASAAPAPSRSTNPARPWSARAGHAGLHAARAGRRGAARRARRRLRDRRDPLPRARRRPALRRAAHDRAAPARGRGRPAARAARAGPDGAG
jgi:serine/threonine protein kinase